MTASLNCAISIQIVMIAYAVNTKNMLLAQLRGVNVTRAVQNGQIRTWSKQSATFGNDGFAPKHTEQNRQRRRQGVNYTALETRPRSSGHTVSGCRAGRSRARGGIERSLTKRPVGLVVEETADQTIRPCDLCSANCKRFDLKMYPPRLVVIATICCMDRAPIP